MGEIYEVEKILDATIDGGKTFYLVKWVGYDRPEDQTWEPIENLTGCKRVLADFKKRLKSAKTTIPHLDENQSSKLHGDVQNNYLPKEEEEEEEEENQELPTEIKCTDYPSMQIEGRIILSSATVPEVDTSEIDSKWYIQQPIPAFTNYLKIVSVFTEDNQNMVMLQDRNLNQEKYNLSVISTFFSEPLTNFIEEKLIG